MFTYVSDLVYPRPDVRGLIIHTGAGWGSRSPLLHHHATSAKIWNYIFVLYIYMTQIIPFVTTQGLDKFSTPELMPSTTWWSTAKLSVTSPYEILDLLLSYIEQLEKA